MPPFRYKAITPRRIAVYQPWGDHGGDGETRTLAPVSRPTPLAGAPRHQLEYISVSVIGMGYMLLYA